MILSARTVGWPGRMKYRLPVLFLAAVSLLLCAPSIAYATSAGDPAEGTPPCSTQSTSEHNAIKMVDHSNGAVMGSAYLVYSAGCQTEWVAVHYYSPYAAQPSVWIQNRTGTNLYEAAISAFPQGAKWTYQLANMKYQTACGGVQMYNENTGRWVGWYYIGCY
jgi:hypothetical protein